MNHDAPRFLPRTICSIIWALGEDADGELYVLANGINSAFGTRGKVFKLVPQ